MFEIGSSLREARLRQGLDFSELEQATKIRAKYLRALEDEQFDLLPSQTYVKGFLRNYAEYLGLDSQLYVDEFNSRYVISDDVVPMRPRRVQQTRPRVQSRVLLLTLLGISAVAALVIVAWKSGGTPPPSVPGLSAAGRTSPDSPAAVTHRLAPVRLSITALRGASWLQVRSGSISGRVTFQGTLERGENQKFAARKLWISLSHPENVRIVLNGHVRRVPTGAATLIVTPRAILRGA